MNDINTTPSRNLAKWATSEDLPPQDLFTSIENYRTYVRRWRALYAEITTRMRAERVKGRYTYALWNKARLLQSRQAGKRWVKHYHPWK